MDIQGIYRHKIDLYKHKTIELKKKSQLFLYIKLLSFCGVAVGIYIICTDGRELFSYISVLLAVVYFIAYLRDIHYMKMIHLYQEKQRVCNNELKYLDGDFSAFDNGERYVDTNHEYSYDLDIFGESSLYNRINRTKTQKGSDTLAEKLTHLCTSKSDITANQQAVAELCAMDEWRIKFLANSNVSNNVEQLSALVRQDTYNKWTTRSILPYCAITITIASLVLGILEIIPMSVFTTMFTVQLVTAVIVSKTLKKAGARIGELHREFAGYSAILKDIEVADFNSDRLKCLKSRLFNGDISCAAALKQLTQILNMFDQRSNVIAYILLNGTVMYDVLLIRRFVKWGEKNLQHIHSWTNIIAEIDALVSLSTYAYNNPGNTYPQSVNSDCSNVIEVVDVYHPFLKPEKAVPNSFILQKQNIAIVTGANMAGKSTFLRTIGVTYIMACCGMPVCAKDFQFSIVSLFSSMRTTDNLSKDISYFNAELIRLEQLIHHVQNNKFTQIILDEILKGTNSKDKLEGSKVFLNEISKHNVSAIIATHDLELANLEQKDCQTYKNYCFEIELSENITYTYKIQNGVARNQNASWLLKRILKSEDAVC